MENEIRTKVYYNDDNEMRLIFRSKNFIGGYNLAKDFQYQTIEVIDYERLR
jgi:hypothetical protein